MTFLSKSHKIVSRIYPKAGVHPMTVSTETFDVVSINVGKPIQATYNGKTFETAIFKQPALLPIRLGKLNFEGDKQGDLVHHGGLDKAVNVYCIDHYPYWEEWLGKKLDVGAFGENVTVSGLREDEVYIGDIFQLGDAILQVSQPRYPCYKLAMKHDAPLIVKQVVDTGFSGFYLRVLQEGTVSAGDKLVRTARHPKAVSVAFAFAQLQEKNNEEAIRSILKVEELAASWREMLLKRS